MPATLVNVIPDKTLLPVTVRDSLAREYFVPEIVEKERTVCDINSTPIPTACKE